MVADKPKAGEHSGSQQKYTKNALDYVVSTTVEIFRPLITGWKWLTKHTTRQNVSVGATVILAIATVLLFWVGILQQTLEKTDATLKDTLKSSKLEQRAWVNVGFEIAGPLILSDGKAKIDILFSVQNTGKLPALSVFPWAQLVPYPTEAMGVIAEETHPACINRNEKWLAVGTGVFPQEIARFSVTNVPTSKRVVPDGTFKLMMVGCVLYRSTQDSEIHRTPFAVAFTRKKEGFEFLSTEKQIEAMSLDKMKIPVAANPD